MQTLQFDDSNHLDENTVLAFLSVMYFIFGICRAVGNSAAFGLITPVHPIKPFIVTSDMIVFSISFAIGGYGVGSLMDYFGYHIYPYFVLLTYILQVVTYCFVIPFHNGVVKRETKQHKHSLKSTSMGHE